MCGVYYLLLIYMCSFSLLFKSFSLVFLLYNNYVNVDNYHVILLLFKSFFPPECDLCVIAVLSFALVCYFFDYI